MDVYGYNLKDGQVSGAAISISNFEADFSKNVSAVTVGWVVSCLLLLCRFAALLRWLFST